VSQTVTLRPASGVSTLSASTPRTASPKDVSAVARDTEMLSFRIYSHEAQAARRVANRRGSTLSALVRLALARYLAEQGERVNGG